MKFLPFSHPLLIGSTVLSVIGGTGYVFFFQIDHFKYKTMVKRQKLECCCHFNNGVAVCIEAIKNKSNAFALVAYPFKVYMGCIECYISVNWNACLHGME